MVESTFDIYVRFYGVVQSGTKLTKNDYFGPNELGETDEFDEPKRLAVSLAVQDVKRNIMMRSKSEFTAALKQLQS